MQLVTGNQTKDLYKPEHQLNLVVCFKFDFVIAAQVLGIVIGITR